MNVKLLIKFIISKERGAIQFKFGLVYTIGILGAFLYNGGKKNYSTNVWRTLYISHS